MTDDAPQIPHTPPPPPPPPAADPQSIEGLFLLALGQSAEQRAAFLDEACGDDAERRRRIEALLRAYEDAGSFLEKPPAGVDTSATVSLEFLTPSSDPGLLGMLGHYEVYEMLGRGGMGIVFRARDPKLNRVVAIKVLAPELAANPNARRRFLREAKTAASISHPHVVTIHAVDEGVEGRGLRVEGTRQPLTLNPQPSTLPYLVMECIVGQTLQQKLDKQGSLRLTEILRIGHQTAQGLAAAHRQGLIHRDIKPANILLENGVERVKITDFGLARAADDASITRTGEVSGTPQYMSPEQASGGTIDNRSDLFSLGCVLYAMCTGRSPFRATTLAAAIRRVCDDTPRPIEEINPEAPHWLIEIVNRLLAKDPDERIQSADEVAEVLGDRLAGIQHPPRVRPAEPSRPSRAVAAVPQPAAAAAPAHGLGMNVPLRVLHWLGAIALLIPVFYALIGTAIGAGGDALEGAALAAVICWPIAVLLFAVALLDRSLQGNPFANAMFLLFCILLGPIGILLYLVRRDQYLMTDRPAAESTPPRQVVSQQPPGKGESRDVPQWLLAPLPGPVKVIGFLLFASACLVLGMAIEQWSDVSQEVGISLYAAAIPLAVLAIQCALGAGVQFRWPQVATLGLLGLILAFLGAQAPDREFKQGLKSESDMVALFSMGLYLVAIPVALLLWGLSQPGEQGRARRDRLGSVLIGAGVTVWGALVAWMLLVAVGAVPPPPFVARSWIAAPIMFAVLLGSLLFGAGMILKRYVVTPGMVRQFATATRAQQSAAGAVPAPGASERTSPWRVLGWLIVSGLVVVPGCFIMAVPWLTLGKPDRGAVQIEFDDARPVTKIVARGDVGAAQLEQRTTEHAVSRNPFFLRLPVGVYDLTMTYQADGTTGTFVQRVGVEAGKTKRLDVRQNIALALQPLLDRQQLDDDGYPPPRTIPLGAAGQMSAAGDVEAGGMPGGTGAFAAPVYVPEGAVLLTIADPGLSVAFEPFVEPAPDASAAMDSFGSSSMSMGYVGDMMGMGMGGWMANSSGTVKLPEGTYRVLVTDQLAGWGREGEARGFGMGSAPSQLPASELPERLKVVAGEFRKLTIARDLKRVAALQPDWEQRGFFAFRWDGVTYDLTQKQAVAVQRLLEAGLGKDPAVHEALLLAPAEISTDSRKLEPVTLSVEEAQQGLADSEHPTLKSLFNDGQHPFWKMVIVEGEEPATYRLAELHSGEAQAAPLAPQPGAASPETAMAALDVTMQHPGLRLYLQRDGDENAELSGPIIESMTLAVEPGTYNTIVEDDLAGWHTLDEFGEPGPVRYDYGQWEFTPGGRRGIGVNRNLRKMAATFPRFDGSSNQQFLWQARSYTLDGKQAPIVAFLLKAYAEDEPEVHEARLMRGGTFTGRTISLLPMTDRQAETELVKFREEGHSLKGLFDDGEHEAWGTLIVAGEKPNTYRLAKLIDTFEVPAFGTPPPETAKLQIDVQDPGLHVYLHTGEPEHLRWIGPIDESRTIAAEPGAYKVSVEDDLAGWRTTTKYGEPGAVRYEFDQITLTPGDTQTLTVDRNFYKMGATYRQGGQLWRFLWNGQTYELDHNQSLAVARLLHALADGSATVHEGRLLKQTGPGDKPNVMPPMSDDTAEAYRAQNAENGNTLKNWFQSGQHPAWGMLVVAGEKPDTWRLAALNVEPAQTGVSSAPTADDAAGQGLPIPAIATGSVRLTIADSGLSVWFKPVESEPVKTTPADGLDLDDYGGPHVSVYGRTGDQDVSLPPGAYYVMIKDSFVGWPQTVDGEEGLQHFTRRLPEAITVVEGKEMPLTVRRDLAWHAAQQPDWSPGDRATCWWSGHGYNLDVPQAAIVSRLLQAYAEGKPQVSSETLLALEGVPDDAQSVAALFERNAAWGTLIVEGDKPDTWQLKSPAEQQNE